MPRKSLIIAMTCLLLLPVLAVRTATTQPARDQFVGTWSLVSIRYVRPDGTAIEPFGPDAKGMLV